MPVFVSAREMKRKKNSGTNKYLEKVDPSEKTFDPPITQSNIHRNFAAVFNKNHFYHINHLMSSIPVPPVYQSFHNFSFIFLILQKETTQNKHCHLYLYTNLMRMICISFG
jgi:hypothetical protein